MKVLIIHTYYQQSGGEDKVFSEEQKLLSGHVQFHSLSFQNKKGLAGLMQFIFSLCNIWRAIQIRAAVRKYKPDVVHIHNWHYAVGPLFLHFIHWEGIPVVMTLHNYRLICPSGTLYHQGEIHEESLNGSYPWKAVKKGFYRGSRILTFWLALIVFLHRHLKTWDKPARFIFLTPFMRDKFLASSHRLIPEKLVVKPNFTYDRGFDPLQSKKSILFAGRLSEEKGVQVLLEAVKGTDIEVFIAGTGPLEGIVSEHASKYRNIHFLGFLNSNEMHKMVSGASLLVFPSLWYEGMPMTIIESFASGTPVLASDCGAMTLMIDDGVNGFLFRKGDALDLRNKLVVWLEMDPVARNTFYVNARQTYLNNYTPQRNRDRLLDIYTEAIESYRDR